MHYQWWRNGLNENLIYFQIFSKFKLKKERVKNSQKNYNFLMIIAKKPTFLYML